MQSIKGTDYGNFSLADFIVNKIREVELENLWKILESIVNKHHELSERTEEDTSPYIIKYRKFKEAHPFDLLTKYLDNIHLLPHENLDKSLRPLVDETDDKYAAFLYDMDKLKNFISYVERYALSFEYLSKYIPLYFLEMYPGRFIETKDDNPEELSKTIETKFKEEIPLLKRYFLMVRLHNME